MDSIKKCYEDKNEELREEIERGSSGGKRYGGGLFRSRLGKGGKGRQPSTHLTPSLGLGGASGGGGGRKRGHRRAPSMDPNVARNELDKLERKLAKKDAATKLSNKLAVVNDVPQLGVDFVNGFDLRKGKGCIPPCESASLSTSKKAPFPCFLSLLSTRPWDARTMPWCLSLAHSRPFNPSIT